MDAGEDAPAGEELPSVTVAVETVVEMTVWVAVEAVRGDAR